MPETASRLTDAQRSALGLPVGDAQRRANNAALFGRLASAAARSNRPDAAQLSAHYVKRAAS